MTPLAPPNPHGYPAPFWLLEVLKVLGFSLHAAPMNLWYAGVPVLFLLGLFGSPSGRRLAARLGKAMPIALALGINFGVVPLLFTQVVNYQFFYTAGVLIAWPWLSVIALLLVAYYGVYLHAESGRPRLALASAGVSALFLVIIGFLFANNFSLMTEPDRWLVIFRRATVAASPTGLALNVAEPTLFPRWLMMFGMALTTTAAYIALDTTLFARREETVYREWAGRFAFRLYSLGLIWFAGFGAWYLLGTLAPRVHHAMLARPPIMALVAVTGASPGLPWLLLAWWRRTGAPLLVTLAGVAQFGVIGLNAVSRQWVQNVELRPYADLAAVPVHGQWLALIGFVALLVMAVWLSAWLAGRLWRAWSRGEQVAGGPAPAKRGRRR